MNGGENAGALSDYDGQIVAAMHADAEAARAEMRAGGIICPSCSVNLADLPDGHALILSGEQVASRPWTAGCGDGAVVTLAASSPMSDSEFRTWEAAASISLWDDFRRREAEAFKAIIGTGPADFTGLLSVLEGDDG